MSQRQIDTGRHEPGGQAQHRDHRPGHDSGTQDPAAPEDRRGTDFALAVLLALRIP